MAVNEKLEEIRRRTLENIARAKNLEELNEVRLTVLGKRGELKELMKGMRELSAEERPSSASWSMTSARWSSRSWQTERAGWKRSF